MNACMIYKCDEFSLATSFHLQQFSPPTSQIEPLFFFFFFELFFLRKCLLLDFLSFIILTFKDKMEGKKWILKSKYYYRQKTVVSKA